jgi:hypothetical protein
MIKNYERLLGGNCFTMDQEEEDTVVLTLKALGNVGRVADVAGDNVGAAMRKRAGIINFA